MNVKPGDDLDALVNDKQSGQTFCVAGGTYNVSQQLKLRSGDKMIGQTGTETSFKTSSGITGYKQNPVVNIRGGSSIYRIFDIAGSNVELQWLDIAGAVGNGQSGTGLAISAGGADSSLYMSHLRVHDNAAQGVGNAVGVITRSEFYNNGTDPRYAGFTGAAIKGTREYVGSYLYVHGERENGLWCDSGCVSQASRDNGLWLHHNVVVGSDRFGIRYKHAPEQNGSDNPSALIEYNAIHGNGEGEKGGLSVADARNALVRENVFGPATANGVYYPRNYNSTAIRATDENRTDLRNNVFRSNRLNGETIFGCSVSGNTCEVNSQ